MSYIRMDQYDRQGNPIDVTEWRKLFMDPDYHRVARDVLPDESVVSTVWLGIDHQYGDGPPLIFETMVFPCGHDYRETDMERYSTEAEAIEGHARMVARHTRGVRSVHED